MRPFEVNSLPPARKERRREALDRLRTERHCIGMSADAENLNFEQALRRLEEIVHKLESGEAPLDESIALYEQGNALRALCQQRLDAAKARIEAISLGADGRPTGTVPFDAG
jgi:exodeoxyribonuclease VII small subunit